MASKRGCRYWRNLSLVALAGLVGAVVGLAYVAFPIVNAGAVAHPTRAQVCCTTPAERGLAYEDVSFVTADRLTIRGWYLPSHNGGAVIVAHGIAGNRISLLEQGAALARHGYGALLLDLRAHGESEGDTITFGGKDVLAAAAYLQGRGDVEAGRIGAWGFSLGGVVVIEAAARTDAIRAVVADGPALGTFRDMPSPENLKDWLWVPFDWVWFQSLKRRGVTAPIAAIEALPQIAPRPILLISGAGKRSERRALQKYYAAAAEPKILWEIPEAGHMGGWPARQEEYEERVAAFFDEALLQKHESR